jgi:hypothetical protein
MQQNGVQECALGQLRAAISVGIPALSRITDGRSTEACRCRRMPTPSSGEGLASVVFAHWGEIMTKITAIGVLGIAVIGVAGCDPEINVREKWGKSIANYGLRGIYPMRENLYPGDIYLYVPNGCGENYVTSVSEMMLLGALPPADIKRAFEQFYGSRPSFPRLPLPVDKGSSSSRTATTTLPSGRVSVSGQGPFTASVEAGAASATIKEKASTETSSDKSAASPQDSPEADSKNPIFNPGRERFTRLPLAALPNISLYNSIGGTVGGAWNWVSGAIGGEDARKVRISATQVEMAELPANIFQQLIVDFMRGSNWSVFESNAKNVAEQLRGELSSDPKCRGRASTGEARLMFVNNVYYTRSLTFEFGNDSAFAARLAASLPASGGAAAPAASFNPPSLPAANPSNPAEVSSRALLANLATMSGGPGGGLTLAVGYSGNLAITQAFARPMAFATQHAFWFGLSGAASAPADLNHPTVVGPTNLPAPAGGAPGSGGASSVSSKLPETPVKPPSIVKPSAATALD